MKGLPFNKMVKDRFQPVFIIMMLLFILITSDLSFLKNAEEKGFSFRENDSVKAGLLIFKDHGYNWIRLRLFHTPTQLPNNLDYTLAFAKEAKENGFKIQILFNN
ncbi:MAG TPA: glycosyl hydrolase 53 family protein [Bacteroidales bacterium]|nr:glycosyl hydrolase 53 family protein [Bacteroidales bacterium]